MRQWLNRATLPFVLTDHVHHSLSPTMSASDASDDFDLRVQQRERAKIMSMMKLAEQPRGNLPNTILTVATISFLLGATVCSGLFIALVGGQYWWMTPQLGFFVAAWGVFHFGEFATTAGWNPEKCSIDCEQSCLFTGISC
jgi:protein-S-isoprenylcysteine O-methyltransferase